MIQVCFYFSAQSVSQNAEKTGRKLGNQVRVSQLWIYINFVFFEAYKPSKFLRVNWNFI